MKDILDQIKKSDASVPDGYFGALPDKIMGRIAKENKVGEFLAARHTEPSGSVPDGYFDRLPDQVMERVRQEENRQFFLRKRRITVTSIAASIALVIGIGTITFFSTRTEQPVAKQEPVLAKVEFQPVAKPSENISAPENIEAEVPCQSVPKSPKSSNTEQNDFNPADEFIESYEVSQLEVMDYEILEYFSDDGFISEILDS